MRTCAHCGEPCSTTATNEQELLFCCAGCRSVYEILQSYQMCEYYDLDEHAGTSQRISRYQDDAYEVLETPSIAEQFVEFRSDEIIRLRFEIPSMHCASCVWLLDRLSRFDKGIQASDVDFMRKTVRVAINPKQTTIANVARLLSRIGYEPLLHGEGSEIAADVERRKRLRTTYVRIGIAGFAAGNLMMIGAAQYLAGMGNIDSTLKFVFDAIAIALSLPVLLYSAAPWFVSAWGAVRHRTVNLDIPVVLGITTLFVRSVTDIVWGYGEGYLDSFAGLVLFLLIGKLFQQKAFDAVSFTRTYRSFFPFSVRVEQQGNVITVPIDAVHPGDVMLLRNGEVIPCDAVLTSSGAFVDYSFVTGESVPVECLDGSIVHAGGRIVGRAARLTAIKAASQSYLASLWERSGTSRERRRYSDLSDRFGLLFTAGVALIALIGFVVWLPDWSTGLLVFTSVLIIACPCALTLAAPVTLGTAMGILGRRGVYVRSPEVLAELQDVDVIAFDKTGTLTTAQYEVIAFDGTDSSEIRQAITSVAAHSTHPISRSIAGSSTGDHAVHVIESIGYGITGESNGYRIAIGSADYLSDVCGHPPVQDSRIVSWIAVDGSYYGAIQVSTSLRRGIQPALTELQQRHQMVLVTGDADRDRAVVESLFDGDRMLFELKPEEKVAALQHVRTSQGRVMMVGDGLNDAAAMSAADVSIAVTEDSSTFVPACDMVMPADSLAILPKVLKYAASMTSVIQVCFVFTVVYNVVGLTLALQGMLSPVITAIMMPVSSLMVIAMSVGGARLFARRL